MIILIPFVQQLVRVDLRTIVLDVPSQDVISRDNVSVKVNAVIYFRVVDADKAVIQVENFMAATSQLAQTTLRSVLGKHELDEMLAERDKLNSDIQAILDARPTPGASRSPMSRSSTWTSTRAWSGPSHSRPKPSATAAPGSSMRRASSKRPRSWPKRRPSWPPAGSDAAALLSTLQDIAGERSSTIVFPVPIDLLRGVVASLAPTEPLGAGRDGER